MQTHSSKGSTSSVDDTHGNFADEHGRSVGDALGRSVSKASGRLIWADEEEDALIQFFSTQLSNLTGFMFKKGVYLAAAALLKNRGPPLKGIEKNADACKTRWLKVCISFVCILLIS